MQALLRSSGHLAVGSTNAFGDKQLQVRIALRHRLSICTTAADFRCAMQADVAADAIVFERMRECGAVETASSEEKPELVPLGGVRLLGAPCLRCDRPLARLLCSVAQARPAPTAQQRSHDGACTPTLRNA